MDSLFSVALRSVGVYLFVIIAIRLFGKKELSQLSIIDLVFILLISNSVQNAMVGDNTSLAGGLTAATALFAMNWIFKNVLYKSRKLSEVFEGNPIMLVYKGRVMRHRLERAKISMQELEEAIREHGVKSITDVDLAVLEVDGNISILSDDFHRKTRKHRLHKSLSPANS